MGLNADNELFWDGKRVEIRRALVLTRFQKCGAVIVSICTILGGIGALISGVKDGTEYFCAREITWLSYLAPRPPPAPSGLPTSS